MTARKGPGRWARRRERWRGWDRWKRWSVTALVGLVVVVLVGGVGLYARFSSNLEVTDIDSALGDDRPSAASGPSAPITVLVIGSDTRKDVGAGYGSDDGTKRSDALLLVHVAGDRSRIDAVQIPRDTMIDRPTCKDPSGNTIMAARAQINGVLDYGAPCLVKTVEGLTDNRIDHYVEIDFRGFTKMINALGGLPICLDEPLADSQAKLDLPAGQQTLGGRDALALARTRKAVGDGSDIGRLAHQQVVMSAVIQRAQSSSVLTRPDRLLRFIDAVTSSLTVDARLDSVGALAGLAREVREVPSSKITFATMPWGADPLDPNRVVPTEEAAPLFARMAADRPIDPKDEPQPAPSEPTEEAQPPSSPVSVLNAGGVGGSASALADGLRAADVSIEEIGNAESRDVSVVQHPDTSAARRDARRLARMLGLDPDTSTEVADVSVVTVLVGADTRDEPLEVEGGDDPSPEPTEESPTPSEDLQTSKASQRTCA